MRSGLRSGHRENKRPAFDRELLAVLCGAANCFVRLSEAFWPLEARSLSEVIPSQVTAKPRRRFAIAEFRVAENLATDFGEAGIVLDQFGTRVDFVPIVLGNGRVRLENNGDAAVDANLKKRSGRLQFGSGGAKSRIRSSKGSITVTVK